MSEHPLDIAEMTRMRLENMSAQGLQSLGNILPLKDDSAGD